MTTSTLSFRRVPAAIYVGLIAGFLSSLVLAGAMLLSSGEVYQRYEAAERWRILDAGCGTAQYILLALGLLELARRQVGRARTLASAAGWLTLSFFAWPVVNLVFNVLHPRDAFWIYDWLGRGVGVAMLGGALALIVAADGWRVAPVAAGCLVVLHLTGYWVPAVGEWIHHQLGDSVAAARIYYVIREAINSGSILVLAAALAARGHDPAADPSAAARGFRLARGALMFRVIAAIAIAFLLFGARSAPASLVALFGGPLLVIATTVVFAIAIERAGRAEIGLPRLRLAIGVALTLWWTAIQLEQLSSVFDVLGDNSDERARGLAQLFTIAGPIAATIGFALIGSSIGAYASSRGDADLAQTAQARTISFVVASLGSVGLQSLLVDARTLNAMLVLGIAAAAIGIIALAMFAGLLRRTAEHLETAPGLPPARILD